MKYRLSFTLYSGLDIEEFYDEIVDADSFDDATQKAHEYLINFYGESGGDDPNNLTCTEHVFMEKYEYFNGEHESRKIKLSETKEVKDNFSEEELLVFLEFARIAMADGEVYDKIAEKMDLSDDYLKPLIEKMQTVLEEA